MNKDDYLTKDEARGKRNTNNRSVHERGDRFDVLDVKENARRKLSRYEEDLDDELEDLVDIDPSFDWSKVK
jgi:hypothetical protein